MSKMIAIGTRITEDLDSDLRALAVASGLSRSRLVADAIYAYVMAEKELTSALDEGIEGSIRVSEALALRIDPEEK